MTAVGIDVGNASLDMAVEGAPDVVLDGSALR